MMKPGPRNLKYELPSCLAGMCDRSTYVRWLQRKAAAHVKRDRKRFGPCAIADYKEKVHRAVCSGGHRDYYTGKPVDWTLISKYNNEESKAGRDKYHRSFGNLPTVDHTLDGDGQLRFVICSWRVNDAKTNLSENEFYELCKQVVSYHEQQKKMSAEMGR